MEKNLIWEAMVDIKPEQGKPKSNTSNSIMHGQHTAGTPSAHNFGRNNSGIDNSSHLKANC